MRALTKHVGFDIVRCEDDRWPVVVDEVVEQWNQHWKSQGNASASATNANRENHGEGERSRWRARNWSLEEHVCLVDFPLFKAGENLSSYERLESVSSSALLDRSIS